MKNTILTIAIILSIAYINLAFQTINTPLERNNSEIITTWIAKKIELSKDVKSIIDNSCSGCHNTKTKNKKGLSKLDFDKLINGDYSEGKTSSKLRVIIKSLQKNDMPPKDFLKKYPNRAISIDDKKKLINWAKQTVTSLKKQ